MLTYACNTCFYEHSHTTNSMSTIKQNFYINKVNTLSKVMSPITEKIC